MASHAIAVIPGDGIGPEVTAAAVAVLRDVASQAGHVIEFSEHRIGGIAIDETGDRRRLFVTGDRSNQIYRIEL